MKKISILAIVVLIFVIGVQTATAITGGELDGEGHPNVGLMIADIDGEPQWRCTGTLISPRVFLTAGHCVGDGATAAREAGIGIRWAKNQSWQTRDHFRSIGDRGTTSA
jgi:secreted trypsin-like serine protease